MNTEIETKIEALLINDNKKVVKALVGFLNKYVNPSFGTIPKREIDLMVFDLLKELRIIGENAGLYEVSRALKISTAKARSLIYDSEIRIVNEEELRSRVKEILIRPIISRGKDLILLQVDNPVIMDYIKNCVKINHDLSDGSFSPTIIKLSPSGFSKLIFMFLDDNQKKNLDISLEKITGNKLSFDKLIIGLIKAVAQTAIPGIGGAVTIAIADYLSPLFSSNYNDLAIGVRKIISTFRD